MPLLYFVKLIQRVSFLFLTVGKLELCAPWDKDRRSVVPLIQVTVVDLRRPERVPIMCGHLRSLVQRQGIRIDGGLGSAAHKRRLHDFVPSYIRNAMNSTAIFLGA